MKNNHHSSPADKGLNAVLTIIVAVVFILGVVAVSSSFSARKAQRTQEAIAAEDAAFRTAMDNGEIYPITVGDLARYDGVSVEDYVGSFGMDPEGITAETTESDFINRMTVQNFADYTGKDYDAFLAEYALTDKVTDSNMLWSDAQNLVPAGIALGVATGDTLEDETALSDFETAKTQYGLGEAITITTPWGDIKDAVEAAQQAAMEAAMAAQQAETADAAVDGAEVQTEGEEAPADGAEAHAEGGEAPADSAEAAE